MQRSAPKLAWYLRLGPVLIVLSEACVGGTGATAQLLHHEPLRNRDLVALLIVIHLLILRAASIKQRPATVHFLDPAEMVCLHFVS